MNLGLIHEINEHKRKLEGPHFIFSAENPYVKPKQPMSHKRVLSSLKSAGYDAHEVQGHYGAPERSILVYGVGHDQVQHLHALAARLGQHSSLYSDGTNHELKIHHGEDAGKSIHGSGTDWHHTKPETNYTSLPGGIHHFSHRLGDMDKSESTDIWAKRLRGGVRISTPPLKTGGRRQHRFAENDLEKGEANPKVQAAADSYAQSKGLTLTHGNKAKVNPEFSTKVAQAYQNMPHNPNHPEVKRAYDALINETHDQFNHLKNNGFKFSRIKPGQENPYKTSEDLHDDIKNNNHMWFFPTDQGFGSTDAASDHPMLRPTGEKHEGHELLANDMFRIVHDYFGHAKGGHSFGANGEESAYQDHAQMYTPLARRALTTETRGQNSWVNFGPHAAHNKANPSSTIFAEQKAGLLPEWAAQDPHGIHKAETLEKMSRPSIKFPNFSRSEPTYSYLWKSADDDTYRKYAQKGMALMYPIKINGQTHNPDTGIAYHNTIKLFDPSKDSADEAHDIATQTPLRPPSAKHVMIEPTIITGRGGYQIHALALNGVHEQEMKEHNSRFKHMGYEQNYEFKPHISVDKATWDRVKQEGHKTAHDAGIEFGDAELRHGNQVLARYPHKDHSSSTEAIRAVREKAKVQPRHKIARFGKSEDLAKGQNGDWKKEGYKISHTNLKPESFTVEAHTNGKKVGHLEVDTQSCLEGYNKPFAHTVHVNPEHQRKGIATAMHVHAENVAGHKLIPHDVATGDPEKMTQEGAAIWTQPNRPFGKSEVLEKGLLRNFARGAAAAATIAGCALAPNNHASEAGSHAIQPTNYVDAYDHDKMLNAIAQVESSGGKNLNHQPTRFGTAWGPHALMPNTIRETIHLNRDLAEHKKALKFDDRRLVAYLNKHPGLEGQLASYHLARLEQHFGHDRDAISRAWNTGITGTKQAMKQKQDISKHPYVAKIRDAYNRGS